MGQEIVYCYKCQRRILGAEFDGGKAFHVGNHVTCSSCAVDLLQTLDHKEREQLIAKMFKATQERSSQTSATLPSQGAGAAKLKKSTVRLQPPPETPAVRPGAPVVPIAIGGVVLVVVVLGIVMTLKPSEKPPPPKESPAATVPRPATPAPAPLSPVEAAALEKTRTAIQNAKDFAAKNPRDLEAQIAHWKETADQAAGTPFSPEVRRELDAALARRKDAIPKEWVELDEKVKVHAAAQQVQAAIDLLQSARTRYSLPEWTMPLDRRIGELYQAAARSATPPTPVVAPPEVKPPAPEPPRPALSPADAAAFARASMRDYAGATDDLKAAAAVLQETQELLAKWPRGQSLAVDAPARVEGALLRNDASRLALKQASGAVWVEIGEITPASLAEIFLARPARKPGDERAAALFCLLEGDVEAARKLSPDKIADKYWQYGATVAEQRRSPKETEARDLYRSSEEGVLDYSKTGPAVEACRLLLKDYAETAFVARNRVSISARAALGKEYLFCADLLKPVGAWKSAKAAKIDAIWTCEKDGPGNAVDLTFTALPGIEYRCWVYVGACCQETFAFSAEGTEMTPKAVKNTIVGLKKTHAMHNGPKSPAQWAWIPVPLPKYATAGVKVVRLVTDQQGFSIADAAITLQKDPPRDSELKEFEKLVKDFAGSVRKAAPAPVDKAGKLLYAEDFSKGKGRFQGGGEIVDAGPGVKALPISVKATPVMGYKLVTKPSTKVRFRVKSSVDLDFFECMGWVTSNKPTNAWYHVTNLKKGEWRNVEFRVGDMQIGWNGAPIMGETVETIMFYFLNRPDDSIVLLTDFEIRD